MLDVEQLTASVNAQREVVQKRRQESSRLRVSSMPEVGIRATLA